MIVLDASALLAHLSGEPRGEAVSALLHRGGLALPTIQLAEAVDVLGRRGIDAARSREAIGSLMGAAINSLIALSEPIAWRAGELRGRHYHRTRRPVSLADCVFLASAGPADAVATLDGDLAAMAREEGVEVVVL